VLLFLCSKDLLEICGVDNVPVVSCILFESSEVRDEWIKLIQRNIAAQNNLSVSCLAFCSCCLLFTVKSHDFFIASFSSTKTKTIFRPTLEINKYNNSNFRSRCGRGNAYFIYVRQVSLPVDFPYYATY